MTQNNKDYIINLRVSRATYEKIRRKAHDSQKSISALVRNFIEDGSEIISDISNDVWGRVQKYEDIVSYHKARIAKDMKCDECGQVIAIGTMATVGETSTAKKYFFCGICRP